MDQRKLVLIDGHAMLYRAWFAFPQTLKLSDGTLTNAVYGFTRILLSVIEEMKPSHIAVSFDVGKTFRHEQFPAYKAHREKMPDELKDQEPIVDRVLTALNIPIIAKEGFEADDVIGTIATQVSNRMTNSKGQMSNENAQVLVVTGDRDVLQIVNDQQNIKVYMPARGMKGPVVYNEAAVKEDLGVRPDQIPDYKGLAGDHSDNIPGVRGIGPKTAVELLIPYETIEGVYANINKISKPAVLKKLLEGKESAFESKRLATIIRDVPLKFSLADCEVRMYDKAQAVALFHELDFQSLIKKLPQDDFEASVQEALF